MRLINAEGACRALNAMRYPPEGKYGMCPGVRGSYYSQEAREDYIAYSFSC